MAEFENLSIVIDIIDSYSEELNHLLVKLGEIETAVQAVDDITIDVDVRGERELDALLFKLGQLEAADLSGVGDIVVGDKSVSHRSGGGGRARFSRQSREAMDSFTNQLDAVSTELTETLTELNENSGDADRNLRRAASAADDAADGFELTSLRMSDIHNAAARLVPILLVIIGALPAVMGAMVSLAAAALAAAAALGALTAFGALGAAFQIGDGDIGAGFEEMMSDISDSFLDAFVPLSQRLAPLFRDALDGLERFFQAVADEGDALVELQSVARDFGQFIIDTVPGFLAELARFARASADAMGVIIDRIGEMGFLESIAGFLAEALPAFSAFIGLVTQLAPHILELSVGFLQVANVMLFVLNIIFDLVTVFGIFDEQVGAAIAGVLALWGAFLLANTAFAAFLKQLVIGAGGAIFNFIIALQTMTAAEIAAAAATKLLSGAVTALAAAIALTGIGAILTVLGGIATGAASAASNIDQATKSLKEFQRQSRRMDDGDNPYGIQGNRPTQSALAAAPTNNIDVTVNEGDAEQTDKEVKNLNYRLKHSGT